MEVGNKLREINGRYLICLPCLIVKFYRNVVEVTGFFAEELKTTLTSINVCDSFMYLPAWAHVFVASVINGTQKQETKAISLTWKLKQKALS
jgi:hypothetical protein